LDIHIENVKKINKTQEVLFIKSGKLRIDLYSSKKYYRSFILNKGDIIFLSSGGHGFKMLKPTEIIEVKQGPYSKFNDKIFLDPVNEKKIKIERK
jgi:mannose-6-phosphate isomerase-like protein (cupin superfamily)